MKKLYEMVIDKVPYVKKKNKTLKWYKTYTHNLYENWKAQCEKNRELEDKLKKK